MNPSDYIENLIADCRSNDLRKQVDAIMKLQDLQVLDAVPVLLDLLSSSEENIQGCAIEALGWLAHLEVEKVGPALIEFLRNPESLTRTYALEALGMLEYAPALELTQNLLLNDPEWLVRATAAETLAELAMEGDVDTLKALELALDDAVEPVRSYAACSIGILGTPSPELLDKLQVYRISEESLQTKAEILAARYRLGVDEDFELLLSLLDERDEMLSIVILNILGDLACRKTPPNFLVRLSKVKDKLQYVKTLFLCLKHQADQLISQM